MRWVGVHVRVNVKMRVGVGGWMGVGRRQDKEDKIIKQLWPDRVKGYNYLRSIV